MANLVDAVVKSLVRARLLSHIGLTLGWGCFRGLAPSVCPRPRAKPRTGRIFHPSGTQRHGQNSEGDRSESCDREEEVFEFGEGRRETEAVQPRSRAQARKSGHQGGPQRRASLVEAEA